MKQRQLLVVNFGFQKFWTYLIKKLVAMGWEKEAARAEVQRLIDLTPSGAQLPNVGGRPRIPIAVRALIREVNRDRRFAPHEWVTEVRQRAAREGMALGELSNTTIQSYLRPRKYVRSRVTGGFSVRLLPKAKRRSRKRS